MVYASIMGNCKKINWKNNKRKQILKEKKLDTEYSFVHPRILGDNIFYRI